MMGDKRSDYSLPYLSTFTKRLNAQPGAVPVSAPAAPAAPDAPTVQGIIGRTTASGAAPGTPGDIGNLGTTVGLYPDPNRVPGYAVRSMALRPANPVPPVTAPGLPVDQAPAGSTATSPSDPTAFLNQTPAAKAATLADTAARLKNMDFLNTPVGPPEKQNVFNGRGVPPLPGLTAGQTVYHAPNEPPADNAQALANLMARPESQPRTAAQLQNIADNQDLEARTNLLNVRSGLLRANVRGSAFNQAMAIAARQYADPTGPALAERTQQAAIAGSELKNKASSQGIAHTQALNDALAELAAITPAQDPTGVRTAQITNKIRVLSGQFGPLPLSPEQQAAVELGKSAMSHAGGYALDPAAMTQIKEITGSPLSPVTSKLNVVSTPAEFAALKSGDKFIDAGDGKPYTKN